MSIYTLRLYASSFDGTATKEEFEPCGEIDHQSNSIQQLADPIMVPVYEDEKTTSRNFFKFLQIHDQSIECR